MIRDASPQAVLTYAAHPIVVYTGCSCPPLTNHFTACPLPVRYQSLHVPYHSLTSKTSYHKGQGTLLCVPWVNVWHVKKDKIIDVSVSTLCGKTEHILISCFFSLVALTSFSRNHYTACQLQFTKGIIDRERFSAHLDSMFGTWVNIRAII